MHESELSIYLKICDSYLLNIRKLSKLIRYKVIKGKSDRIKVESIVKLGLKKEGIIGGCCKRIKMIE